MSDPNDTRLKSLVRELVEASPPPPPLPTPPGQWSRPRVRVAALAAALVLVIAGAAAVGYVAANRGDGDRTTVRAGPGREHGSSAVIDTGYAESTFVDFATGASRTVTFARKAAGDFPYTLFVTGGYFVYPGGEGTLAVPTALDRPPRTLGTSTYDIPSSAPGRVWLITTNREGRPVPITAQEVSVDGTYQSPKYQLPDGAGGAIASVNGGLVLVGGTNTSIWYPNTNTTGPELPNIGSAFVDVHDAVVAWGVDCTPFSVCPSLETLDVSTNSSRAYQAPPETAGWVSTGGQGSRDAFSPDGRRLALRGALTPGAPNTTPASRVYVLDLATGTRTLVPNSEAPAYSRLAWTPDSQWVLFENDNHTLGAYRPTDAASRAFPQQCCGAGLLTVTTPKPVTSGTRGTPIRPASIVAHVLSPVGGGYKSEVVQLAADDGHVQRVLAEVPDGIVVYAATAGRDAVYVDAFDGSTGCPGQAKSLGSVLRVPRKGGDPRLEAHGFRPALSPDATRLAYVRADCGEASQPYVPKRLAIRQLANDEERVWSLPQPYTDGNAAFENVGPLVWSADRTHLLMRIVGGDHTSWWWVNTTAPAGALDATQLPIPDGPRGPLDIIALETGRWAALMPGQSPDGTLAIVEYNPVQATAGEQLTTIQPPGGSTARLVDADASGQHLLLIVTEGQTQTSTLYSWSRGETQPSELAQHVVAADW